MSYNLLLDTGFNKKDKHWKFTNCEYKDGYLIANDKLFSVEQQITLSNPTKLYCRFDYIAFDKDIKQIYAGIQTLGDVETSIKKPIYKKRRSVSVISQVDISTVVIKFIFESDSDNSSIYIDSPLLIDLCQIKKPLWSKSILDKFLDYRYGFDYENLYKESEFSMQNSDLISLSDKLSKGKNGVVLFADKDTTIKINFNGKIGHNYLIKICYLTVNDYGDLSLSYGQTKSVNLDDNQQFLVLNYNGRDYINIDIFNQDIMPYIVNLKYILISDITDIDIDVTDIAYMPYIS